MNARQKKWLAAIHQHPCIVTGSRSIQAHHVVGREGKHNKIHIGHAWILPLHWHLHDVLSNHPANVTYFPEEFEKQNGTQKELFLRLYESIAPRLKEFSLTQADLPTEQELMAIQDYHK